MAERKGKESRFKEYRKRQKLNETPEQAIARKKYEADRKKDYRKRKELSVLLNINNKQNASEISDVSSEMNEQIINDVNLTTNRESKWVLNTMAERKGKESRFKEYRKRQKLNETPEQAIARKKYEADRKKDYRKRKELSELLNLTNKQNASEISGVSSEMNEQIINDVNLTTNRESKWVLNTMAERKGMNDQLLVGLVRERPVIYNMRHPKYLDTELKGRIWQEIGHIMNMDGSKCKARWNNIRDNYRKSLNKRRTISEQSGKPIRPYRYEKHIEFLKEYLDEREPKTNIKMSASIEDSELDADNTIQRETLKTTYNLGSQEASTASLQDFEIMKHTPKSSSALHRKPARLSGKKKKRSKSTASTLIKHILQKCQEEKPTSSFGVPTENLDNPVDSFLHGLAPTLKSLSPYLLNLAKSEIFSIVQKYELQMITEQANCPTPPETST